MQDESRRTILCVDDEKDVTDALYDTFMDAYDVKTATGGKEALEIFNENDISLVITDQKMPEMAGTELLAKINEIKPICKKILLTGHADINAAIDAINTGSVDKYFSKPWDDGALRKAVEDLLAAYKIDTFLEKVLEDGKRLKQEAKKEKRTAQLFEEFLDSYNLGICVVGNGDNIEYLNKKGLEIIGYKGFDGIRGKDFKEIFLLNEINERTFREKYERKDLSFHELDVKLGDGSKAQIQASVMFGLGESGVKVFGMAFDQS